MTDVLLCCAAIIVGPIMQPKRFRFGAAWLIGEIYQLSYSAPLVGYVALGTPPGDQLHVAPQGSNRDTNTG